MKRSKKFSLRSLVSDNRFILVCSLLIAVVFWAAVCISFSPETQVVIEDVPVEIDMKNSVPAQYGLQMFGEGSYSVDITVSGSRYVVGGKLLSKNDFNVTADTSSVTSAGTHSLQIRVSKANNSDDFTIDAVSESFINVYFDEYAEKQANIVVNVSANESVVEEGFISGDDYIMDKNTVLVSGPAIEIAQLKNVAANVEIEKPLTQSQAFNVGLTAVNTNGAALRFVKIDGAESATAAVTVPVYKMTTLPVEVNFVNSPKNFVDNPISYTCTPSRLNVAVLQNGTEQTSIVAGKVDFSDVESGDNTFEFEVDNIDGVKKGSTSVKVITAEFSIPDVKSRTVSLLTSNLGVLNAPAEYEISFVNSRINNVTLYGSETEIDGLDADKITFSVDLASVNIEAGRNEIKVPLLIKGTESCWIYGTYTLILNASAK